MKEKDSLLYLGLDVSKATLDCDGPGIKYTTFENNSKGHKKLITFLLALKRPVQIILEPSGGYERPAILALQQASILVSRAHAVKVRSFAKALGKQAKTDQIDAKVLAEFGKTTQPPALKPADKSLEQLRALCDLRENFIADRTSVSNRLEQAHIAIHSKIKKHIAFLEKQITSLNADIKSFLEEHEELHSKAIRLQSVNGVGLISAATLLANLPELGLLNKNQIGALCGLAPYNYDSGSYQGRRFIRGGRSSVRRVLYMATVCAIVHNTVLKRFYNNLVNRNKPKKLALIATMRKLIICLNSLLKNPNFSLAS